MEHVAVQASLSFQARRLPSLYIFRLCFLDLLPWEVLWVQCPAALGLIVPFTTQATLSLHTQCLHREPGIAPHPSQLHHCQALSSLPCALSCASVTLPQSCVSVAAI